MMKTVTCENCGSTIVVHGLGRKSTAMPLINVCECLVECSGMLPTDAVIAVARKLGCSPALVYKILKANRLKAKDVMEGGL